MTSYPGRPRSRHRLSRRPGRGLGGQQPDAHAFGRKKLSPRGRPSLAPGTTLTAVITKVTTRVFKGGTTLEEAEGPTEELKSRNRVCITCQTKQKMKNPGEMIQQGVPRLRRRSVLAGKGTRGKVSWREHRNLKRVKALETTEPEYPRKEAREQENLPETQQEAGQLSLPGMWCPVLQWGPEPREKSAL